MEERGIRNVKERGGHRGFNLGSSVKKERRRWNSRLKSDSIGQIRFRLGEI